MFPDRRSQANLGLMSVAPRDKNDRVERESGKNGSRYSGKGRVREGIDTLALRENSDGPSPPPRPTPLCAWQGRRDAAPQMDAFSLLSWRRLLWSPNSIYSRWLPGCLPRCVACCGLRPRRENKKKKNKIIKTLQSIRPV